MCSFIITYLKHHLYLSVLINKNKKVFLFFIFRFLSIFQISESIALVGEKESLKSLEQEYKEDEVYLSKTKALAQKYSYIRRTRPDGNCFFRAFSYAYLEKLIGNKEEYDKFRELALKSKDSLVALGFPQFTVEDFHDTVSKILF